MNIFDRARKLVAQSSVPLTMSEALSQLSKRRGKFFGGYTKINPTDRPNVASQPVTARLPYKDE